MRMGSRSPLIAVAVAMAMMVVVPGCRSGSQQPTPKIIKYTFYGVDPSFTEQREIVSWTSQDNNGPIEGTETIQVKADGTGAWTMEGEPEPFQGTQHGNEIEVPSGHLKNLTVDVHGTIQQNGHRLHLDSDLGVGTYDLYDSPSVTPAPIESQTP